MSVTHLEEPEFIWGVWGTQDNGADVADVDISAGHSYSCRGVVLAWARQVWGYGVWSIMKPGIPYIDRWTSGCRSAPMVIVSLGPNTSKAKPLPAGSHTLAMRMIPWFDMMLAISEWLSELVLKVERAEKA